MAAVAEHMVLRIGLPFFIFEVFFQVAPLPQAVGSKSRGSIPSIGESKPAHGRRS
jgi:hypothetical protein